MDLFSEFDFYLDPKTDKLARRWVDGVKKLKWEGATYEQVRKEDFENPESAQVDPNEPDYLEEELLLAALLFLLFKKKTPRAKEAFNSELANQFSNANRALNAASGVLTKAWLDSDVDVTKKVKSILDQAAKKGAADLANGEALLNNLKRYDDLIDRLVEVQKQVVNGYFDTLVRPKVTEVVEDILNSTDFINNTKAVEQVLQSFEKGLERESYYRVAAQNHISRAYHYGALKAGKLSSLYTFYEYVAVMDDRTTQICRSLNGRQFPISVAITYYESILNMSNEELKTFAAFPSNESYSEWTEEQLIQSNIIAPPQHFNCRSTLRLVTNRG